MVVFYSSPTWDGEQHLESHSQHFLLVSDSFENAHFHMKPWVFHLATLGSAYTVLMARTIRACKLEIQQTRALSKHLRGGVPRCRQEAIAFPDCKECLEQDATIQNPSVPFYL